MTLLGATIFLALVGRVGWDEGVAGDAMRGIAAAVVVVWMVGGPAGAAVPGVRDLLRVVKLADPRLSPDGTRVALVETRADVADDEFRSEIVLVDLGRHTLRALTRERHHAGSPRWSPSGDRIAFIAPDGDKVGQLWVLPMDGGEALQVTHQPKDADVEQFAWSPDGTRFAFVATDTAPERKGEDKYRDAFSVGNDDFTQTSKPLPSHVWLIGAGGGDAKRLTRGDWSLPSSFPPGPPSSPIKWSADGKALVIVRQATPSTGDEFQSTVQVVDVASGKMRGLTGAGDLEGYPVVSADGRSVAYWRNRDDKPWNFQDVWVAPFAGGAGRDISAGLDKNVYGTWWRDDGSLLVGGNDGTGVGLWRLGVDGAARRLDLHGVMPTNGYWIDADAGRGGRMVFVGQTASDPYELYAVSGDGAAPVAVTAENAGLANLHLARSETVTWQGPDGRTLDGVVTHPAGATPAPLVLYIHGGPNSSSRQRFSLMPQVLAAKGWEVFEPNYRGSDNGGNAFFAAIYQDAGKGPGEDVMAGVAALEKRGGIDASRVAVSGWSYGGFMTTWLLGHYGGWKAAVAGAAVTDWVDMYDLSDGNITTSGQVGGSPYLGSGMAAYRAQSPDSAVDKITAPTLVMSDTGDFRVPDTQSFGLFRALRDNHVKTAFYAYPVGGHFPGDPIRQMDVYQRWVDWLGTYLK